jgi:hypothetical protein
MSLIVPFFSEDAVAQRWARQRLSCIGLFVNGFRRGDIIYYYFYYYYYYYCHRRYFIIQDGTTFLFQIYSTQIPAELTN